MFIPRTLNADGIGPGGGALGRALIVGAIVAAALFLVLSANITLGQENLEEGALAPRDIRAPREATFDSASLTAEAREAAAADVLPRTTQIKPPTDNRADQLAVLESLSRRLMTVLERRDSGAIDAAEVRERIARESEIMFSDRATVEALTPQQWEQVVAAVSTALDTTLQLRIVEDDLVAIRAEVRELITADLPEGQRVLAGNLAASLVEPTDVVNEELTQQEQDRARAAVPPVPVTVRQGELIVAEGQAIGVEEWEELDALGLTQPLVDLGT